MVDPHEGSRGGQLNRHVHVQIGGDEWAEHVQKTKDQYQQSIHLSCWSIGPQLDLDWKGSRRRYGVALQTTYARLEAALISREDIGLTMVRYSDYLQYIPESTPFWPFIYKSLSFEAEREIRAIAMLDPYFNVLAEESGPSTLLVLDAGPRVIPVPVDFRQLLTAVIPGPDAPSWAPSELVAILRQFGLSDSLVQSA